jgi:hypothetical protein
MSTTNEIMSLIVQACDFPATEIEIRRFCLSKGVPAPEINYAMDQALAFGWITLLDPEEPQAQYAATKMGRNSQDALRKPERAPSSDNYTGEIELVGEAAAETTSRILAHQARRFEALAGVEND